MFQSSKIVTFTADAQYKHSGGRGLIYQSAEQFLSVELVVFKLIAAVRMAVCTNTVQSAINKAFCFFVTEFTQPTVGIIHTSPRMPVLSLSSISSAGKIKWL